MPRSLITFVIVVVLATASSIPRCEIACSFSQMGAQGGAQGGTAPAEGLTRAAAGDCHQGAGEDGTSGKSSSPHPCNKKLQHRMELSARVASQVQTQLDPLGELFGGPTGALGVTTIFKVSNGLVTRESTFLSAAKIPRLSLRI